MNDSAPPYPGTLVLGLIGGVASGKSFVAKQLHARGAIIIDADSLGHQALHDPNIQSKLRARFGDSIFVRKEVQRSALASLVFGPTSQHTANRRDLEAIVHPWIRDQMHKQIQTASLDPSTPCVVLDAPLLLEGNWDEACDKVLFVDASSELRQEFAKQRGWDITELERRERSQLPLDIKRQRADWIITNTRDPIPFHQQVDALWKQIQIWKQDMMS